MSFQIVGQRHRLERRPRQVAREQLVPQATEAAVEALAAEALDEHLEALQEPRQALVSERGPDGQGRLSDHILRVVTDPDRGLFPKPGKITLTCDCPDWAVMCKHAAGVLYGSAAGSTTPSRAALPPAGDVAADGPGRRRHGVAGRRGRCATASMRWSPSATTIRTRLCTASRPARSSSSAAAPRGQPWSPPPDAR